MVTEHSAQPNLYWIGVAAGPIRWYVTAASYWLRQGCLGADECGFRHSHRRAWAGAEYVPAMTTLVPGGGGVARRAPIPLYSTFALETNF